MYDKEQKALNITSLYLILKELHPEREISLQQVVSDYESVLNEVSTMVHDSRY
jgi:hypothetical protein